MRERVARRLQARLESSKDPYEGLPVDPEFGEPLLPRWFVITLLALVPVALVLGAVAFTGSGGQDTPVAERRPPPEGDLTTAVGEVVEGEAEPGEAAVRCPELQGIAVAGSDLDRARLEEALELACPVGEHLVGLADAGAILRFAGFAATGVEVTTRLGDATDVGPTVYVNARFSQQDAAHISPLLAHEAALLEAHRAGEDLADASVALEARVAEHEVCEALLDEPTRACGDAEDLLEEPDPLEALRAAGYE